MQKLLYERVKFWQHCSIKIAVPLLSLNNILSLEQIEMSKLSRWISKIVVKGGLARAGVVLLRAALQARRRRRQSFTRDYKNNNGNFEKTAPQPEHKAFDFPLSLSLPALNSSSARRLSRTLPSSFSLRVTPSLPLSAFIIIKIRS